MKTPERPTTVVRERTRHPLAVRTLEVAAVRRVVPAIARITLRGEDLRGFTAPGPADHVKVFFPRPDGGELIMPLVTEEGIKKPKAGKPLSRDYTPLAFREAGDHGPELDIDFVLHGDGGPASAWAARARPGDRIGVAGPRGSQLTPTGVTEAILVADETSLPATARWLAAFGPETPVTCLVSVEDPSTAAYLEETANTVPGSGPAGRIVRWFSGPGRDVEREAALRALAVPEGGFVFLAGEARALIPLRRYLRRELRLPKQQVSADGYWKRGKADLDHHAPLDPSDPDE
ncbi:siderophore-interacting protein [Leucobacter sp. CSA1]|uniref:Siderophore-interacting protein n=1 Tax=Leucobacter chromiisoli TaxID=2796471 RepID=A0A934UVN9_9MICO|nr:siderophore-interacting protein [Leucobacter chromiisoli]MBK0419132.1 siderophore-interacting protein [Leucobacter chromiisoli]